jgi:hypothetical protein
MKLLETIWMAFGSNVTSHVILIIRFVHKPPRNSRLYNPNFAKQSDGGTELEAHTNADILVTGDTYSRTGTRHTDLPQFSLALGNEDWDSVMYME